MKHKKQKVNEYYKVDNGKIKRVKKVCDRCGDGTFMAEHDNRWYCGKCGMTIWKKKESENKTEESKDKKSDEEEKSEK